MSSNDTARPRFYKEAVEIKSESEKAGRPIFAEQEYVEITIPGDRLAVFVDKVTPDCEYTRRWPDHYAAFKRGEQRAVSGTPLEHWPIVTTSKVAELKALNILSVEELAAITDTTLNRLGMGGRELRDQARAYLDAAKNGAGVSQIVAENAALKAQMEALQAQVAQIAANATAPKVEEPKEDKALEDCTDAELKAYIKRETGEAPRGTPSRETLLARAHEIASGAAVVAGAFDE